MIDGPPQQATAQAKNVTFELHTLGWEAFQNLCGHVLRESLGQSVNVFSPTKDAGQDGAFHGVWKKSNAEIYEGKFVFQCKFTSRRDEHISLSHLSDELEKARRLAKKGLVQTYILITNHKVSGEACIAIQEAFLMIDGIKWFNLFGSEWLTEQIISSARLRVFVPRVYGLGDLSQIIDTRVYRQANEILLSWKQNLAKFVPTEAHKLSIKALLDGGFVLLSGDAMAGKSTIAASLALAAADHWKCSPLFITMPAEFTAHWNPDEPNQFFWVDDAFGQTQFSQSLAEGWNRIFPLLNAAIQKGTKILFTSRSYIYTAAKCHLKESAFPPLAKSHVVIHVERLSFEEKQRILYNHIRLGNQPKEFRTRIKPFLKRIASNQKFFPEIAKRLGDSFFTGNLILHEASLDRFVEQPIDFLCDIINKLDRKGFGALALLFMRAGRIAIPPTIDEGESESLSLLDVNLGGLVEAFNALDGSLVSHAFEAGGALLEISTPINSRRYGDNRGGSSRINGHLLGRSQDFRTTSGSSLWGQW